MRALQEDKEWSTKYNNGVRIRVHCFNLNLHEKHIQYKYLKVIE